MNNKEITAEQIDAAIDLYSKGEINEAIKKISSLNEKYPNVPLLYNLLGACFISSENWTKAEKSLKIALKIKPDYADAHFNLGNIFLKIGLFEKAIESFKNVITSDSVFEQAHFNLGVAYHELGRYYDAIESYESALEINRKNINTLINLGNTLRELDHNVDAIEQYEKIIEIEPDNFIAHNNLGTVFRSLNQTEKAIIHYKKASELKPDYVKAYYNLGFIYQDMGEIDEAISHYEKAIELDNHATSFHSLSHLKKFLPNDIYVNRFKSLQSSKKLSQSEKIHIYLALANISEKNGNQVDFFNFLNKGNKLQKTESGYSLSEHLKYHKAIKKMFGKKTPSIGISESITRSKKTPLFILGMPRSGTTLVEQIISSHKQVYGAGELNYLTKLASPILKNFIQGDISSLSSEAINFVKNEYLNRLEDFNVEENFITDKLPLNFQYIGFIFSAFPGAKIIHLERDARAVCWSNYRYYFGSKNNGYSNNFSDLSGFYASYKNLMSFWNNLFPGKIYNICYEDLTENQEEETKSLIKYCGLEWDENCLDFHNNNNLVKTISSNQVKKKMYKGSSEAWKKHWAYIQPLIDGLKDY